MCNQNYTAIDAWDKLIGTLYGREGQRQIESFIKRMELGLIHWLPKWTILVGRPGTGKTTLISIICRLFEDYWTFISDRSPDFGQYNGIVSICYGGCDISRLYANVMENFNYSDDYHILAETNQMPDNADRFGGVEFIYPTGQTIPWLEYQDLLEKIQDGIPELKLYFREVAAADFIERKL